MQFTLQYKQGKASEHTRERVQGTYTKRWADEIYHWDMEKRES